MTRLPWAIPGFRPLDRTTRPRGENEIRQRSISTERGAVGFTTPVKTSRRTPVEALSCRGLILRTCPVTPPIVVRVAELRTGGALRIRSGRRTAIVLVPDSGLIGDYGRGKDADDRGRPGLGRADPLRRGRAGEATAVPESRARLVTIRTATEGRPQGTQGVVAAGLDRSRRDPERRGGLGDRLAVQVKAFQHGPVGGWQFAERLGHHHSVDHPARVITGPHRALRRAQGLRWPRVAGPDLVDDQVADHGQQPAAHRSAPVDQHVRVLPGA
ncbi:hypothetical protein Acsp01_10610 [Actinoplanes sp. NBRC 101535]|nr:hypothetical protein Acsp01_10610 [Actinoplanes sp. NBRC 101535]